MIARKTLLFALWWIVLTIFVYADLWQGLPIELSILRESREVIVTCLFSKSLRLAWAATFTVYIVLILGWRFFRPARTGDSLQATLLLVFICAVLRSAIVDDNILNTGDPERLHSLLFSILIGQIVYALGRFSPKIRQDLIYGFFAAFPLVVLIGGAIVPSFGIKLFYHGSLRHSGLWTSPNTYGALASLSFLICLALAGRGTVSKKAKIGWLLGALIFLSYALHSYSRGAWVGLALGGVYLLFYTRGLAMPKKRILVAALIGCGIVLLVYGYKSQLFARIGSFQNINDFSWRNRLAAYEGALQMMINHFWSGVGWDQNTSIYRYLYCRPSLSDWDAIGDNDLFWLGAAIGVPGLIALIGYIVMGFIRSRACGDYKNRIFEACVISSVITFWFHQELMSLSLAIPFWTCLEGGNFIHERYKMLRPQTSSIPRRIGRL